VTDEVPFDFRSTLLETLPHLRAFARSLTHNRDFADDMVHDAVVRALTASSQFTPGTNFRAWMFTILRNLFYNEGKKWRSRAMPLDEATVSTASISSPQEANLEFADFRRAFWQLTVDQREVLTLVGAGGLSYEQAATVCNCRVGTIKSRVSRARSDLKRILDSDDISLPRSAMSAVAQDRLIEALNDPLASDSVTPRLGQKSRR
jgi:RNA polymerase sigma-70 factor (ECF subfamily)